MEIGQGSREAEKQKSTSNEVQTPGNTTKEVKRIAGIVETRVKENKAGSIAKNIATGWSSLNNYASANNGRIWVMWDDNNYQVTKIRENAQMIHCEVIENVGQVDCLMTIIYDFNTIEKRKCLWEELKTLAQGINKPWIVIGDFNAVIYVAYRNQGNPIQQGDVQDFVECMQTANLNELLWKQKFDDVLQAQERDELQKLEKWAMIEESIMKHKSRDKWIKLGDANTKYFSAVMKERNHRKQIKELMGSDGNKINKQEGIQEEILRFYKGLMDTATVNLTTVNREVMKKGPTLNKEQRMILNTEVTRQEVYEGLKGIGDDKAPGIDGYNAIENPVTIKEYRPIAYCTVLYKLISNILAARMQKILGGIVCDAQAGFVPGRRIGDNIILAHELVKGYTRKHITPRCMIKIDLQKAYDSVEWSYLE
ncbi:uncharacterized protein LOC107805067 [Nicotiana tabacum]|uniref:Uncharacterized protein LOC107805067 n=1 Tax=Nicotiana tabacum TaxID=4097 RepID=A0AC58S449_TOBAC